MPDDLIGIGNSVAANQHQITSLKDDLVYIHGQMRNTTAILHQLSNGLCMMQSWTPFQYMFPFIISYIHQLLRDKNTNTEKKKIILLEHSFVFWKYMKYLPIPTY